MIIRFSIVAAMGLALSACQPAVPDSARGAGFDTLDAEQSRRDAALAGTASTGAITGAPLSATVPPPASVSTAPLGAVNDGSPEATAAETARILDATRPGGLGNDAPTNSGAEPLIASPSNPAPPVLNTEGISRENNFDAVSDERSIEGDAARLAANRAQYRVIQPEALPDRADAGPNIVAYALQSSHPVGTQLYTRRGFNKDRKFARACAEYSHPDQAQIAFLSAGGPQRDREGMDPDGDGYACNWDPTPYRKSING